MSEPFTTLHLEDCHAILDSLSDGVFTTDLDMRITYFNKGAERITGFPREHARGKKCFDIMRSDVCKADCCIKRTIIEGKRCDRSPIYITRADNARIPISVTSNIIVNPERNVIGAVESFRDLWGAVSRGNYTSKRDFLEGMVSINPSMLNLFDLLPNIAESSSTLLIEGATGTGKEVLARTVHRMGPRYDEPFVVVNCAALPDTLIEAELFGYKAGAFTDARRDKPGWFAAAGKGTLFLDEIGDISPAMQVRLLRVLEDRTFSPLGSNNCLVMEARVIAATNRDLKQLVDRGLFRQDLYFRINVVRVKLPDLRERLEDIPLLIEHFLHKLNIKTGKMIEGLSDEAKEALVLYHWPGNIRELENAMEHAFVMCRGGLIALEHLPEHIRATRKVAPGMGYKSLEDYERLAIINALIRNQWKRMATARELNIDKNTLRRKIQRYGISLP